MTIDPKDLQKRIAGKEPIFILDVREPQEYRAGHVEGAVLIPLGDLPKRCAEVPKDKQVVVCCKMGGRSSQAVEFLRKKGYDNILNLSGGYDAWAKIQNKKQPGGNSGPGF
jgi:rhodanese-related sulfurtransferase